MTQALDNAPASLHGRSNSAMRRMLPLMRSSRKLAEQLARVGEKVGLERSDGSLRIGLPPARKITELHDGRMACAAAGRGDMRP